MSHFSVGVAGADRQGAEDFLVSLTRPCAEHRSCKIYSEEKQVSSSRWSVDGEETRTKVRVKVLFNAEGGVGRTVGMCGFPLEAAIDLNRTNGQKMRMEAVLW